MNKHILSAGILLIILSLGSCQRRPIISFITREQVVDIGGTANLDCSVQYGQDYPVLWVKLDRTGSLTLSSGTGMIIREKRFSLLYDITNSTYTLQIKDIEESDAGIYQCQVVISISNKTTEDVSVLVRTPPVIVDNTTKSVVVSKGQHNQLHCYAYGFPTPRIYWRRKHHAILPTGGSVYSGNILDIPANKEFRGTYYCVADNGVGKGTRRNVIVDVEFVPVVRAPRLRMGQSLNFDIDIACHVESSPVPSIIWMKDNQILIDGSQYQISNFATAGEFTNSTLRVLTIEKRQYGRYICKAENKLGSGSAIIELFETAFPLCRSGCKGYDYANDGNASSSFFTIIVSGLIITLLLRYKW